MPIYISLLRGINIGGHKLIKMDDLKQLYMSMGFQSVTTYIQSGNVAFFCKESSNSELQSAIEKKIQQAYGFMVPVVIRTEGEMKSIISDNPFAEFTYQDAMQPYVTFFQHKYHMNKIASAANRLSTKDKVQYREREAYIYCEQGYGRTKLNNNFFETKSRIHATTRNWKTVLKLTEIAKAAS